MRTHSLNALGIIVCFLLCAAPAFSRGSPEAGLKQVESLIAEKDFSGAQRLLVEIRRKNPELIDPTQELLDRIMVHERQYNGLRRELLEALDRKDVESAEALITRMEDFDPHKSLAAERRQVKDLRAARGLGAYMDTVTELLEKGWYAEAISAYLTPINNPAEAGFAGQRDAFLALKDAALYVTGVQNALESAHSLAVRAAGLDGELRGVASAVEALPATNAPERAAADFGRVTSPLRSLAGYEAEIRKLSDQLASINVALQASKRVSSEDVYVRYMVMLLQGREGMVEGILGAIRLLWEEGARSSTQRAVSLSSASFEAALRLYDQAAKSGDPSAWAGASEAFLPAAYRSLVAVEAGKLLQAPGWTFTTSNREGLEGLRAAALASQESADESMAFRTLIALQREAGTLPTGDQGSVQTRRAAQELIIQADALSAEWRSRSERWSNQAGAGMDGAALSKAALQMSDRFAALAGELRTRDLSYALQLARTDSTLFESRFTEAIGRRREGEDLLNGTRQGKPSGDPNEVIPRYPGRALGSFEAAQAALDRLSESLVAWKVKWGSDLQVVAQSAGMRALASQVDDLQGRVAGQSAEITGLRSRAQESLFNAEKSRRDAEAAYAAAERDFAASAKAAKAAARQYLDNARTAAGNTANALFNASLALEENAQARTRFEKDIPALLARIEQARFQQDVKEVDALIDEAIERFRKERFLDARLSLDRARELWNQMPEGKKGPYDLLEGWYARVLAALAVSGDRVLVANDPRLDVISPLMSRASEMVAEAERLADDAERLRGANAKDTRINDLLARKAELLSQAGTHVASVLSVAGGYAEAKVLQLRIRRLADPAGFQRTAREAVTKAIGSGLARDATNIAQKEAMNELTDYEKVVDDRALRVTINDALKQLQEKVYGWKLPSTEEIAQASALVAEAQRRFRPADPATYEEALTRLNAAIAITGRALPDQTTARAVNRSARDLRERILNLRQAATITVTTLSRKDQETFAMAQELLNSGGEQNELRSWDLIQPLLPKYPDFQPLNRMQAVLKARLRL